MNLTLDAWVGHGWLRRHRGSRAEVANLQAVVERECRDSTIEQLSLDAKLGMLYNAALTLADVALRVSGYRAAGERHHYRVITSLPLTLGRTGPRPPRSWKSSRSCVIERTMNP